MYGQKSNTKDSSNNQQDTNKEQNNNIQKYDPRLMKDYPFTILLNKVIQNIDDLEIIGLYTYLASLPPEWIINKEHLKSHFKIGTKKIESLFRALITHGLLIKEEYREKGRFVGVNYRLCLDSHRSAENGATVNGATEKRVHINKTNPTKEIGTKKDISPSISPPKVEKQKKQKDILSLEDILNDNPFNLTRESLRDWLAVRKTKRLPLTETAWKKQLNQLKQFEAHGCDVREVFIYGVGKGWAGIEIGYDGILERFNGNNKGSFNQDLQKTQKNIDDELKKRNEESVARAQKQAEEFLKEKGIDISQTKGFPTKPILKVINR